MCICDNGRRKKLKNQEVAISGLNTKRGKKLKVFESCSLWGEDNRKKRRRGLQLSETNLIQPTLNANM